MKRLNGLLRQVLERFGATPPVLFKCLSTRFIRPPDPHSIFVLAFAQFGLCQISCPIFLIVNEIQFNILFLPVFSESAQLFKYTLQLKMLLMWSHFPSKFKIHNNIFLATRSFHSHDTSSSPHRNAPDFQPTNLRKGPPQRTSPKSSPPWMTASSPWPARRSAANRRKGALPHSPLGRDYFEPWKFPGGRARGGGEGV